MKASFAPFASTLLLWSAISWPQPRVIDLSPPPSPSKSTCSRQTNSIDQTKAFVESLTVAECDAKFTKNKCEKIKNRFPASERWRIISCKSPAIRNPNSLTLIEGCGQGIKEFAVNAVTGALQLPEAMIHIGKWYEQCRNDANLRRSLLSPVAMTYSPEEIDDMVNTLDCSSISERVRNRVSDLRADISRKKMFQKLYVPNHSPVPASYQLTPAERAFMNSQHAESALSKLWDSLNGQLKCYTTQAKAELACKILANVGAGAVMTMEAPELTSLVGEYAKAFAPSIKDLPFSVDKSKIWFKLKGDRFTVGRPLKVPKFGDPKWPNYALSGSYDSKLGTGFLKNLQELKPNQHWIDMGAGNAAAIKEYFEDPEFPSKANVTAIGVRAPAPSDLRTIQKLSPNFKYLSKRTVESYSASEVRKADLISDLMGPIHYSQHVDQTISKELSFLKVGGRLYTNENNWTTILSNGKSMSLTDYFHKIRGVQVLTDPEGKVVIEKTSEDVIVPPLKLNRFKSGTPPDRTFTMVELPSSK